MELIFGGAYQGKTQYAAQKYGLTDADIFTCEDLDLDPDARCIRHLERFARACTEAGLDAREEFARRSPRACVLIADDISCGIVPLDRSERTWRKTRKWCETADELMPMAREILFTHCSLCASSHKIRSRVGSQSC